MLRAPLDVVVVVPPLINESVVNLGRIIPCPLLVSAAAAGGGSAAAWQLLFADAVVSGACPVK